MLFMLLDNVFFYFRAVSFNSIRDRLFWLNTSFFKRGLRLCLRSRSFTTLKFTLRFWYTNKTGNFWMHTGHKGSSTRLSKDITNIFCILFAFRSTRNICEVFNSFVYLLVYVLTFSRSHKTCQGSSR